MSNNEPSWWWASKSSSDTGALWYTLIEYFRVNANPAALVRLSVSDGTHAWEATLSGDHIGVLSRTGRRVRKLLEDIKETVEQHDESVLHMKLEGKDVPVLQIRLADHTDIDIPVETHIDKEVHVDRLMLYLARVEAEEALFEGEWLRLQNLEKP